MNYKRFYSSYFQKGFQVRAIAGATLFKYVLNNRSFSTHFRKKKLKFYYDGRFESNGRIAGEPYY